MNYISNGIDEIKLERPHSRTIVCGDFNKLNIYDLMLNHNLRNIVTDPTRNDSILDLILIDEHL